LPHRVRDRKHHLCTLRASDPIALHGDGRFGPIDLRKIVEQPIGIASDAQQPLAHVLALDRCVAALASAVEHLFVSKPGLARWTPVDRRGPLIGEPRLEQLQEDPLGPAHILGIGRVDFPLPVVGEADQIELATEIGHGLRRGDPRVDAGLDRIIFSRQPEGIPAERVQDVEALHAFPARDDIARRISLAVTDVQPRPRWIGKHVQHIEFGTMGVAPGQMDAAGAPAGLPLRLNGFVIILQGHSPAHKRWGGIWRPLSIDTMRL
jgi:hypothetical protein